MMPTNIKPILLIFFASLIIYSNSLSGEFVYDDEYFIVKNISIRNLENAPSFFKSSQSTAFADLAQDVYRPITILSYAVDYLFWRLDTFGYHLVNTLFHSLNAVGLFILLYAIFGDLFLAFFASLFFTCHPVQTEAVSWISGRASVLFVFFYLCAFIFYVYFLKRSNRAYFVLSLISYAVSLFSKEMAVTLPLLLIAYDVHFFNAGPLKRKIYRYAPYFILTLFYLATRTSVLGRLEQCGWWGDSPYHTFLTMSRVMVGYIKLLFVPLRLCAFYIIDVSTSVAETKVLASISALALLFAALPFLFRRFRRISFSVWWFFITILPVSNIVPLRALMAERFLYLPSIGFCIFLAVAIERIKEIKFKSFSKAGSLAAILLASVIAVSYSIRTMIRNEDWKDSITSSRAIIEVSSFNPWAYTSLGASYIAKERYEEAVKALKKAIALSKYYASPWHALGFCYIEMGRYDEAIGILKHALVLKPNNLETLHTLGVAYARAGRHADAIKKFEASIKLDPSFIGPYLNLGAVYERKWDYAKALEEYQKIPLHTNSKQEIAISYIRIGDVCLKMRNADKARTYYKKAVNACDYGLEELKKVAQDRLDRKWE